MANGNRPLITLIRPGFTVRWQPPRYCGDETQLIFHIKVMSDEDRRRWQHRLSEAQVRAGRESDPDLSEKISLDAMAVYRVAFVGPIENVPGWIVGHEGVEETFTVGDPDKVLKVINSIPGNDGKALESAISNINTLEAGMLKNSNCSSASPSTRKDEPASSAETASDSSASETTETPDE
jgi:hypothetical protein